jgi:hypothetical protein
MPPTAIPAVKVAIKETLKAASSLDGVEIAAGRIEPLRATQYIWFPKAKSKRDWAGLGAQRLKVKISVPMLVVVVGTEDPEARAFEICGAAEAALRSNLRLDGKVVKNLVEEIDEEPRDFDKKLGHHVWMTVVADTTI